MLLRRNKWIIVIISECWAFHLPACCRWCFVQAPPPAELQADMTTSSPALLGYYAEQCQPPQLRGQAVYVQLTDQSADFKRDAMQQVTDKNPRDRCMHRAVLEQGLSWTGSCLPGHRCPRFDSCWAKSSTYWARSYSVTTGPGNVLPPEASLTLKMEMESGVNFWPDRTRLVNVLTISPSWRFI